MALCTPVLETKAQKVDEGYRTTGERMPNGESTSSPRPVRAAPSEK